MGSYAYFPQSGLPVFDAYARPVPGARLYFYAGETTTPITVYRDADLTTAHPWPVECDAGGMIPGIYLSLSGAYNVVVKDASDALIRSIPRLGAEQAGESSIQSGKRNYAVTTGTSSAYVGAFSPAFIGIDVGTIVYIDPHVSSVAGATFDAGTGPFPITLPSGQAAMQDSLLAGRRLPLLWSGTSWVIAAPWPEIAETTAGFTVTNLGGAIIQCGTLQAAPADYELVFPRAFKTKAMFGAAIAHIDSLTDSSAIIAHVNNIGLTSMYIRLRRVVDGGTISTPPNTLISWIAIGYDS